MNLTLLIALFTFESIRKQSYFWLWVLIPIKWNGKKGPSCQRESNNEKGEDEPENRMDSRFKE